MNKRQRSEIKWCRRSSSAVHKCKRMVKLLNTAVWWSIACLSLCETDEVACKSVVETPLWNKDLTRSKVLVSRFDNKQMMLYEASDNSSICDKIYA